ncbi:MAG TPA: hypothetical protein VF789_00165 [Thermoanaerobaculia bacterium]
MRKFSVLVIVAILLAPLTAHALSQWTAVGVSGSFASANIKIGTFTTPIGVGNGVGITYYAGSAAGTDPFPVAYNVTSYETLPPWTTLTIGYSGVVSGTSIVATLYSVAPATGIRTAICSVSSLTTTTTTSCTFSSSSMDFSTNAYYVEVIIDRSTTSQFPTINYVGIN